MDKNDELVEKVKDMYQEKGKEISDNKAREGADNLVRFFDLLWIFAKEDGAKKRRLKKEPGGFPTDGTRNCLVCNTTITALNGWYDWYGQTCLVCRKAVLNKTIPTYIFKNRNSYFTISGLNYTFKIKSSTTKKDIKEGKLIPRIILNDDGTPHEYIFLKEENPCLIERYSAERKSYDRHRAKQSAKWARQMKAELMEEHRKRWAGIKKYNKKS